MGQFLDLLSQVEQGGPQSANHLLELVYDELRRLAALKMAREAPGQTLQATALVGTGTAHRYALPGRLPIRLFPSQ